MSLFQYTLVCVNNRILQRTNLKLHEDRDVTLDVYHSDWANN